MPAPKDQTQPTLIYTTTIIMSESDSTTLTFDRFALPGFTLPLNFKPSAETSNREATGEGKDLFSNALDKVDLSDGWVA